MPSSLLLSLREYIRARAENRPGVYRMIGPGGELLYVGKSVRVRSRLLSYFRADRGEKAWEMIRETDRVEWEYVPNEFGALVREMRLIQRAWPKYNVQHKRKRSYAFVKVTNEPAARVVPVTRVVADGATYFGPFPRVKWLRDTIRELTYVTKLRDCPSTTPIFFDDQIEAFRPAGGRTPLCMRGELGTCLAPCSGQTSSAEYTRQVEVAKRFLEKRSRQPVIDVEKEMEEAVQRLDFEYAAVLRDRRDRLVRLQEELSAWRGRVESLNFVYRVPGFAGADRVYFVRKGLVAGWAQHPKNPTAREQVTARVRDIFLGARVTPDGLTPHQAAEVLLVARWFRLKPKELKRTYDPQAWLEEAAA